MPVCLHWLYLSWECGLAPHVPDGETEAHRGQVPCGRAQSSPPDSCSLSPCSLPTKSRVWAGLGREGAVPTRSYQRLSKCWQRRGGTPVTRPGMPNYPRPGVGMPRIRVSKTRVLQLLFPVSERGSRVCLPPTPWAAVRKKCLARASGRGGARTALASVRSPRWPRPCHCVTVRLLPVYNPKR